jgi:GT2 family glycosyltransferase/glycosyltransferase involved in cell wall biosynthesis
MKLDAVLDRNVLIFALSAEDVKDAIPVAVESLQRQGARLICLMSGGRAGLPEGICCREIGPDLLGNESVEVISRLLQETKPVCVLLPALANAYEQLAGAVWESMRRIGLRELIVGELEVPLPFVSGWLPALAQPIVPASNPLRNALRQYRSESLGLSQPGHAYWQVDVLDKTFPGCYRPQLILPKNPYRIDIIIRTAGRDTLGRAIESVLTQNWPNIGLIIVNVGPRALAPWLGALSLPSHISLKIVEASGALRATAGNLGLQATTGEAFVFLDDDDQLYASHLSVLAGVLDTQPGAVVAYGGVRVEHQNKDGHCIGLDLLDEPFDLERLYLENFIPIHACLVRRRLLDQGVCFDESLNHFEDWDFWLKCAEQGTFVHVPEIVGIYYVGDASGVAGAGMQSVRERWLARKGAEPLERIAHWALSKNTPGARAYKRELDVLVAQQSVLLQEIELGKNAASQARLAQAKEDGLTRLGAEINELKNIRGDLERRLKQHIAQQARLEAEIATLRSSTSWRVMAPVRGGVTAMRLAPHLPGKLMQLTREHGGGLQGLRHLGGRFIRVVHRQGLRHALYRGAQFLNLNRAMAESDETPAPVMVAGRVQRPPVVVHGQMTDIVICIHNALEDVQRCIASVQAHTKGPYHLILVDDGSAEPTRDYLASNFGGKADVTLLRHEEAGGYTKAANAGLRAGRSPFVVLLNSDTVVGPEWLDRLLACLMSDQSLALVGPLSNCASWQSVPEIESRTGGDWAENPLPEGWSPEDMAKNVAADSMRIYPRLGFINGFCQLLRRSAVDEVGLLDEQAFPQGYGEENDLCLRLRKAGWLLAVADDVWVYHAQSKSYSNERRKRLCDAAALALASKHGQQAIDQGVKQCREDLALLGLRYRVAQMEERQGFIKRGQQDFAGRRVLFLLPSTDAGGGANVIMTEAAAMRRMGVDVVILNLKSNEIHFTRNYGDYPVPVHYVLHPGEVVQVAREFDAVIASIYYTVDWLGAIAQEGDAPVLGYYVQDFEPYFFKAGTSDYAKALASYSALPGLVRFCKTRWNRDTVKENTGQECVVVGPSFDIDLFRPAQRPQHDKIRICAMIRPNSPYRSPALTMNILGEVWHARPGRVEIVIFGVDQQDPDFLALRQDFSYQHHGKLNSRQIAEVLDQTDIFVDLSTHQAMGLTALEAMASYTAVVMPGQGGTPDIAEHEVSALFIDAAQPETCLDAVLKLVDDQGLRHRLADSALKRSQQYFPEKAAYRILQALLGTKEGHA